jgi:hypothetical protein
MPCADCPPEPPQRPRLCPPLVCRSQNPPAPARRPDRGLTSGSAGRQQLRRAFMIIQAQACRGAVGLIVFVRYTKKCDGGLLPGLKTAESSTVAPCVDQLKLCIMDTPVLRCCAETLQNGVCACILTSRPCVSIAAAVARQASSAASRHPAADMAAVAGPKGSSRCACESYCKRVLKFQQTTSGAACLRRC